MFSIRFRRKQTEREKFERFLDKHKGRVDQAVLQKYAEKFLKKRGLLEKLPKNVSVVAVFFFPGMTRAEKADLLLAEEYFPPKTQYFAVVEFDGNVKENVQLAGYLDTKKILHKNDTDSIRKARNLLGADATMSLRMVPKGTQLGPNEETDLAWCNMFAVRRSHLQLQPTHDSPSPVMPGRRLGDAQAQSVSLMSFKIKKTKDGRRVARQQKGHDLNLGDRVDCQWDGVWYPSEIIKARPGEVKVHFDGWDSEFDLWVPARSRYFAPLFKFSKPKLYRKLKKERRAAKRAERRAHKRGASRQSNVDAEMEAKYGEESVLSNSSSDEDERGEHGVAETGQTHYHGYAEPADTFHHGFHNHGGQAVLRSESTARLARARHEEDERLQRRFSVESIPEQTTEGSSMSLNSADSDTSSGSVNNNNSSSKPRIRPEAWVAQAKLMRESGSGAEMSGISLASDTSATTDGGSGSGSDGAAAARRSRGSMDMLPEEDSVVISREEYEDLLQARRKLKEVDADNRKLRMRIFDLLIAVQHHQNKAKKNKVGEADDKPNGVHGRVHHARNKFLSKLARNKEAGKRASAGPTVGESSDSDSYDEPPVVRRAATTRAAPNGKFDFRRAANVARLSAMLRRAPQVQGSPVLTFDRRGSLPRRQQPQQQQQLQSATAMPQSTPMKARHLSAGFRGRDRAMSSSPGARWLAAANTARAANAFGRARTQAPHHVVSHSAAPRTLSFSANANVRDTVSDSDSEYETTH